MKHDLKPYNQSVDLIGNVLEEGRGRAGKAVNSILVHTYWQVGKHIVEFEQGGSSKSEYGSELLNKLSKNLTLAYGKGFSRSNLYMIRKLYFTFPKIQTLSGQLSWSHFTEILKADNEPDEIVQLLTAQFETESNQTFPKFYHSMKYYNFDSVHSFAASTTLEKLEHELPNP